MPLDRSRESLQPENTFICDYLKIRQSLFSVSKIIFEKTSSKFITVKNRNGNVSAFSKRTRVELAYFNAFSLDWILFIDYVTFRPFV